MDRKGWAYVMNEHSMKKEEEEKIRVKIRYERFVFEDALCVTCTSKTEKNSVTWGHTNLLLYQRTTHYSVVNGKLKCLKHCLTA